MNISVRVGGSCFRPAPRSTASSTRCYGTALCTLHWRSKWALCMLHGLSRLLSLHKKRWFMWWSISFASLNTPTEPLTSAAYYIWRLINNPWMTPTPTVMSSHNMYLLCPWIMGHFHLVMKHLGWFLHLVSLLWVKQNLLYRNCCLFVFFSWKMACVAAVSIYRGCIFL